MKILPAMRKSVDAHVRRNPTLKATRRQKAAAPKGESAAALCVGVVVR
jgi:hypothetical protein